MAVNLSSLLIKETKSAIYTTALAVALSIGLPVTTWHAGDPTRSQYYILAEILSTLEEVVANFIASGFLDYATGAWLEILAKQVFNVDVPAATFATTKVTLTNTGGGLYPINPGDLTFKNTVSGKTYHNTSGGTLASGPGTTLVIDVEADEAGSASSAAAGEITTLVTGLLGVTCTNATAAVGVDKQDEATTRQQCRDKLGSLSPNGPKEAYSFVARDKKLSGTSAVTKVRVYGDNDTGDVTVYLAGANGGVAEADRALVEAGIIKWATPVCITPTVLAASNVVVNVTYELWLYKSVNQTTAQVQAAVQTALQALFASTTLAPIGGNIIAPATTGSLHHSMIEATIKGTYAQVFRVNLTTPAGDTALTNGQVATLGTVTGTINFVNDA